MTYTLMKYLRISSEDVDLDGFDKYESNSIANQRAFLDNFISKTPEFQNCTILETLDDGRSGTNFDRPGVTELLNLAQKGAVNCIVVKDLSRFGRNFLEVGDYLEQIFPAWGVRFISVTDMYDSAKHSGATGGIDIAFRNLIYEMYSQDLSEKVRTATAAINRSGKTTAPYGFYGYIKDPNDRHRLLIDEESAKIVRLIYDMAEQGHSTTEIARKLNTDGIPTPNMRRRELGAKRDWRRCGELSMWDSSFVARLLSDERYTGKHIYGKSKKTAVGKHTHKSVPKADWIVVENVTPEIIPTEQYRRVREIIEARPTGKSHKAPGKGLLFYRKLSCGHCGHAMPRKKSGDVYVYQCQTPSVKDGLGCMNGSIRESVIIETVLAVIRQQAALADSAKRKRVLPDTNTLRDEARSLRRLIEKLKSSKMLLWEKQHTGDMKREAFQRESIKLSEQIAAYEAKIEELESKAASLEMESGRENRFVERYSKQLGIEKLTHEIVEEFVKGVRVYAHDRIEVILNYADEYAELSKLAGE